MASLLKRGGTYHMSATINGNRVRVSLGTQSKKSAARLIERVDYALADGPKSAAWDNLKVSLPPLSYSALSSQARVTSSPVLAEFAAKFQNKLNRRVALNEIAQSSATLYEYSARKFFDWLESKGVRIMDDITPQLVSEYQVHRKETIMSHRQSSNARSLVTDGTVLQAVFELAREEGALSVSPMKDRFKAQEDTMGGAEPFTDEEIEKLDAAANGAYRLPYLLLKWTGLRGSDATDLTWGAIDLDKGTLCWQTRKRKNWVTIPIHTVLWSVLKESPGAPDKRVLGLASRSRLYNLLKSLGEKTGVKDCHPHRFRDTLAVAMLAKGATMYDVAKTLGDTIATVETHYTPFVDKLQDRVRNILEG